MRVGYSIRVTDLEQRDEDLAAVRDNGFIEFADTHIAVRDDEVRLQGTRLMDIIEIQRLLRIFEMVIARRGQLFLMLIAGQVRATPTPEVRRCIAEWGRHHRVTGTALVGGNAVTRAVVTLTARALAILRQDVQPITFVETETAARRWFDELRKKQSC